VLGFLRKRRLKRRIEKALADGVLSDAEAADLAHSAEALGVDPDYIASVRSAHARRTFAPILAEIARRRRFSLDDEARLAKVAHDLQITPRFGPEFALYRRLWEAETTGHMTLEPITVDIRLKRGEQCYHSAPAVWAREKTVRRHHGYAGASIGFRVARGVTLRFGRAVPVASEDRELVDLAEGDLYVTDKRLIFVGDRRSTTITLGRILDCRAYEDALLVVKSSGPADIFRLDAIDIDYTAALLQSL